MRLLIVVLLFSFSFATESLVKFSKDIKVSGKPIIFIFTSNGCPYCERLKKDFSEVEFLNKVATQFDIYEIPRDKPDNFNIFGEETTTQTLQMIFKIKVTPYIVIFSSKGEKIWQIPGYSDPFLLSKVLKFVLGLESGKYKKEQWQEYLLKNELIKKNPTPH